jgi:hypothetical protein
VGDSLGAAEGDTVGELPLMAAGRSWCACAVRSAAEAGSAPSTETPPQLCGIFTDQELDAVLVPVGTGTHTHPSPRACTPPLHLPLVAHCVSLAVSCAVRMLPIAIPFHSATHLKGAIAPVVAELQLPQPAVGSSAAGERPLAPTSSFLCMGGDALRVPVLSPHDGRCVCALLSARRESVTEGGKLLVLSPLEDNSGDGQQLLVSPVVTSGHLHAFCFPEVPTSASRSEAPPSSSLLAGRSDLRSSAGADGGAALLEVLLALHTSEPVNWPQTMSELFRPRV